MSVHLAWNGYARRKSLTLLPKSDISRLMQNGSRANNGQQLYRVDSGMLLSTKREESRRRYELTKSVLHYEIFGTYLASSNLYLHIMICQGANCTTEPT